MWGQLLGFADYTVWHRRLAGVVRVSRPNIFREKMPKVFSLPVTLLLNLLVNHANVRGRKPLYSLHQRDAGATPRTEKQGYFRLAMRSKALMSLRR